MDRRKFLKLFGLGVAGAAAAAAIDPDMAGWVKGAKTFFLPTPTALSDADLGISIRMVREYDIVTDAYPMRMDVLYGTCVLRPELAARVYVSDEMKLDAYFKTAAKELADKIDADLADRYMRSMDYPGRPGLQDTLRFHKDAFSLAMA